MFVVNIPYFCVGKNIVTDMFLTNIPNMVVVTKAQIMANILTRLFCTMLLIVQAEPLISDVTLFGGRGFKNP